MEYWLVLTSSRSIRLLAEISSVRAQALLDNRSPERYSAAQRMSWAASRTTTRSEDRACSLMGILSSRANHSRQRRERL
ncbi:hypothetical protein DOTSEDRAFT_68881 [Dothistroma septosporum NZE10]|uniref:Uncharacterized protein n=1 Tax=Dothistroma septosporum (strain NZE10 / CBS 128990) TaxID=675120 RepID=N1Q3A1_DOTSN|nr:hypothetical protein DOTSEDRAFT_68881 [Dothistroma septosporum NZE10]